MEFETAQEKMLEMAKKPTEILGKKGSDYGHDNFIISAKIASILTGKCIEPHDVALVMIGIKLARYYNLIATNKEPVNESIDDTVVDMVNYVLLMNRERMRHAQTTNSGERAPSISAGVV